MCAQFTDPQFVNERDVKMLGPGYDDSHYITVPIKRLYDINGVCSVGVCHTLPGDETCVFALEQDDDCAYYPTGWKYKVKNSGNVPGKFFYVMTAPPGIKRRFDKKVIML